MFGNSKIQDFWDFHKNTEQPLLPIYYIIIEIKPCGLGSRIRDMEAES